MSRPASVLSTISPYPYPGKGQCPLRVDKRFDQTVRRYDFPDKFQRPVSQNGSQWTDRPGSCRSENSLPSGSEVNTDLLEKMLSSKIQSNLKNVLKALQLHDYNRDGLIQRLDLHRIFNNHCFLMSEKQFDKLYRKHDFLHKGSINYKEFLQRLGVSLEKTENGETSAVIRNHGSLPNGTQEARTLDSNAVFNLETDFRRKIRDNLANVKRMFLILDKSLDGFISIEDLRSILNNFAFPMSDKVFTGLMERFGIKASGKVSWEAFLRKFQDPFANRNGQTIPIRPGHRFLPIRGSTECLETREVIDLVCKHIKNNYPSLRKAFLDLDKNRDGKISRNEIRCLLDGFAFRLSSEQFKELMVFLDPSHSNLIDYPTFLDLFEERESTQNHKWLNSCHRHNDHVPAVMSWSSLELSIRDKVEANRKAVMLELDPRDTTGSGKVPRNTLRKVLEKYSIPVSDEHFQDMVRRFSTSGEDDMVDFSEFFSNLGTDLDPADRKGLSHEIIKNNKVAFETHKEEQQEKMNLISSKAKDRTSQLHVNEIIAILKDKMNQKTSDLWRSFQYYARQNKNKISKKDFCKILEYFGFSLTNEDFDHLCRHLSFVGSHMTYTNFLLSFEDLRPKGAVVEHVKQPNHRVNRIRGDDIELAPDELETRLRQKLRENFGDLREAFYKFDDDHDGFLTKSNFSSMLQSLMLISSNRSFENFCKRIGITGSSRISYEDFLNAFQELESTNGHRWLTSVHRFNETRPTELWSAEDAHQALVEKAHIQWNDLAEAFCSLDRRNRGRITPAVLREQLSNFMIPLDGTQFNILWSIYDPDKKGSLSYNDFRKCLLMEKFTPNDLEGLSRKIDEESRAERSRRLEDLDQRMEKDLQHQVERVGRMSTDELMQVIKTELANRYVDFQTAFKTLDVKQKEFLSSSDIQKMLLKMNLMLDDDQLYDLLEGLGLAIPKSRLSYQKFLKVFEDGRGDSYEQTASDDAIGIAQMKFSHLASDDAGLKLRKKITELNDVLMNACKSLDQQLTGRIPVSSLRSVLDNFCFKMTDVHFKEFLKSVCVTGDNIMTVDYVDFLSAAKDTRAEVGFRSTDVMSFEEVLRSMKQQVTQHRPLLLKAFQDADFAQLGVISKEDFFSIFKRFILKVTPEEFDAVWAVLPANEFGNLEYLSFIKDYSVDGRCVDTIRPKTSSLLSQPSPPPASANRPRTSLSRSSSQSVMKSSMSRSLDISHSRHRPFTPLVNAADVETRLCTIVLKHWRDMMKFFRGLDLDFMGEVYPRDFRNFLEHYGIDLTEEEIIRILQKFDLNGNHKFNYSDFVHHFLFKSRHQEASNTLENVAMDTPPSTPNHANVKATRESATPDGAGGSGRTLEKPSISALDVKTRIQSCLRNNFKEMRNTLRGLDPTSSGFISREEFHELLRVYKINLTEGEFSDVVNSFDQQRTGRVAYNDFFRDYLVDT